MLPYDDGEDHNEDRHEDDADEDHYHARTDAHNSGDRDCDRGKSRTKTERVTTTNDDNRGSGFDDARDIGTDNPYEDVPRTTVAITAGGRGLPCGFLENVRVTTGFRQGSSRVRRRSRLRNAEARRPRSPHAHDWESTHSLE